MLSLAKSPATRMIVATTPMKLAPRAVPSEEVAPLDLRAHP